MTPNRHGKWNRVSRQRHCPICEKADWCLYAGPETDPTAVICARIESDHRCREAGWLHRLRESSDWQLQRFVKFDRPGPTTGIDFGGMTNDCEVALSQDRLTGLADSLWLSSNSLRQLRIGWSECHRAFTFPMTDANGSIRGIRLRRPDGRKFAVKGGHDGLFIPVNLDPSKQLLICEGPTDTAAMLDLGFVAVGRPSCNGGVKLLVDLVKQLSVDVVVVADVDGPGRRGAESLVSVLLAYAKTVRLIEPPNGIKDARAWKQVGATKVEVEATIMAAPERKLNITSRKAGGPWTD